METESVHATRSFDAPTNPPNSQEKPNGEVDIERESLNRNQGSSSNAAGDGPNAVRPSTDQGTKSTGRLSTPQSRVSTLEPKSSVDARKQSVLAGEQSIDEDRLSSREVRSNVRDNAGRQSTAASRVSTVESKSSIGAGKQSTSGVRSSPNEGRISTFDSSMGRQSTAASRVSTVEPKSSIGTGKQSTSGVRLSPNEGRISTFDSNMGRQFTAQGRLSSNIGRTSTGPGTISMTSSRKSTTEGRLPTKASRQSTVSGRASTNVGRRSTLEGRASINAGSYSVAERYSTNDGRMSSKISKYSSNLDKAFDAQRSRPFDTDGTTTTLGDTIHYMSPVSPMSMRSVYEGDYSIDYLQFLQATIGQEGSSYKSSTISCMEPELQRTIAIVKPDAMKYEDVVVRAITEAGFSTISKRYIHFTPEQVSEFYSQYYGTPAFPHQVVSMSVGPVLVLSLADMNAVSKWRNMVGPDRIIREEWFVPMSMRVRCGLQEIIPNAVHASENFDDANKENRYIYPRNVLEPFIQEPARVSDYCGKYVNTTLLDGLTTLVKTKPMDPILYLAEWLLRNNPYQPQFSKDINLLPT